MNNKPKFELGQIVRVKGDNTIVEIDTIMRWLGTLDMWIYTYGTTDNNVFCEDALTAQSLEIQVGDWVVFTPAALVCKVVTIVSIDDTMIYILKYTLNGCEFITTAQVEQLKKE